VLPSIIVYFLSVLTAQTGCIRRRSYYAKFCRKVSLAHAFFKIINDQLAESEYRLYAIGGGDLGGMFLTQPKCETARTALPRKEDWPYLPQVEY
jgi:hypothetical protein